MMDFSKLTEEELQATRDALNEEIGRRREIEREQAREELGKLLNRVIELQDIYGFEIACEDDCGSWISSADNFVLMG
jgi:hypothetical protein